MSKSLYRKSGISNDIGYYTNINRMEPVIENKTDIIIK